MPCCLSQATTFLVYHFFFALSRTFFEILNFFSVLSSFSSFSVILRDIRPRIRFVFNPTIVSTPATACTLYHLFPLLSSSFFLFSYFSGLFHTFQQLKGASLTFDYSICTKLTYFRRHCTSFYTEIICKFLPVIRNIKNTASAFLCAKRQICHNFIPRCLF